MGHNIKGLREEFVFLYCSLDKACIPKYQEVQLFYERGELPIDWLRLMFKHMKSEHYDYFYRLIISMYQKPLELLYKPVRRKSSDAIPRTKEESPTVKIETSIPINGARVKLPNSMDGAIENKEPTPKEPDYSPPRSVKIRDNVRMPEHSRYGEIDPILLQLLMSESFKVPTKT